MSDLGDPPPSRLVNAMTVDVEDYFQVSVFDHSVRRSDWETFDRRVEENTARILDLFESTGVQATFFVLGWVAEHCPALVRRIAAAGHEIASHGYGHRLVYEMTPDSFRDDVRRSKALLESATGRPVAGYRAPSFSVVATSLWALDVLLDEGFEYDASIFPVRHDRYGMPGTPRHPYRVRRTGGCLIEAPGSTVRVGPVNVPVAGGGYFRILPYSWTRWGIGRINRTEKRPAIFYIHPWEVDPDQPRLPASRLGRFRHYRNLAHTEARLRRLLSDFRFGSLAEVLRDQIGDEVVDLEEGATSPRTVA